MVGPKIAVLGSSSNQANARLVGEWQARGLICELVEAHEITKSAFQVVLGRIDVRPTLDGVQSGLLELFWLERAGMPVLNSAPALLTTHDKLRTATALQRAGLPHPQTWHLSPHQLDRRLCAPVVLKPRFGSWGHDVRLCRTDSETAATLREFAARPWFRRHGVLVQEVVAPAGFDLRILVAGGHVVGAIERHPQPGEWRTNVSVGATRHPVSPDPQACAIAIAAANAAGADLVGVDLMPHSDGTYVVIELNGAAEFEKSYSPGHDIYGDIANALGLTRSGKAQSLYPLAARAAARPS